MPVQSNNKYFKHLCENLESLGLNSEDVKQNYRYSGGNEGRHKKYFDKCFPNKKIPELVDKCLCEHPIQENCYISNDFQIDTILILVIVALKNL